jgi:hypothetical protein
MKISDMEKRLKKLRETHGDLECTMTGTLLAESKSGHGDVFESTIETLRVVDHEHGSLTEPRLKFFWQM